MNSVVLVNPRNDFASFKTFEVLSIGYLASYIEQHGFQAHVYDCNFDDPRPEAVAAYCKERNAAAVGFTSMVGTLRNVFHAAVEVAARLPSVPIACGGYSATFEDDVILGDCPAIDFVFRGEGELSFLQWLRVVHGSAPRSGPTSPRTSDPRPAREGVISLPLVRTAPGSFGEIPGLVFRESGTIRRVPGPALVEHLDDLPFPRRSEHLERIGLASILSSRGCSATCTFCSIQEFYRISSKGAIRCRSAANVVDEVELLHRRHGITKFLFIDDNFFMSERFSPGRLKKIAQTLIERGLSDVRFEVSSRAIDLRLPELDELVSAGLDLVYVGVESGSATQLKRYRKASTPEKNAAAIREIRSRGLRLDFGFIPYDPYLEPDELIDNLRFLDRENLITPETLNTLTVTSNLFPGTPLHDRAKEDGLLRRTDDYYYWFDFKNRTMAPIYEDIIQYFKTRYIINVVDAYANGVRQRNYAGPGMESVTRWLRRIYSCWVKRVESMIGGAPTTSLDVEISELEGFLSNALSAHLLINRLRRDGVACSAQEAGLEQVVKDAAELDRCLDRADVPEKWRQLFAVESRYREAREIGLAPEAAREIRLEPSVAVSVEIDSMRDVKLIDLFVPPDIDVLGRDQVRPADMAPPMLYLGSVTGMPPIDCQLVDPLGKVVEAPRLFKGWSELAMPATRAERITFLSHVHVFKPVLLRCLSVDR